MNDPLNQLYVKTKMIDLPKQLYTKVEEALQILTTHKTILQDMDMRLKKLEAALSRLEQERKNQ